MAAQPVGASAVAANQPQLAVLSVSKRFGGVIAIEDVTVAVRHGEILSVIGPNGAGKTSLINMISGFYCPSGGSILLDGCDITTCGPRG